MNNENYPYVIMRWIALIGLASGLASIAWIWLDAVLFCVGEFGWLIAILFGGALAVLIGSFLYKN